MRVELWGTHTAPSKIIAGTGELVDWMRNAIARGRNKLSAIRQLLLTVCSFLNFTNPLLTSTNNDGFVEFTICARPFQNLDIALYNLLV